MTHRYLIRLSPLAVADGGGWMADVPDLPGCVSDGETPQEALDNVMDAIGCWLATAEADGRPIPAAAVSELQPAEAP